MGKTEMSVLIIIVKIDLNPELIHGVYRNPWLIATFCSANNILLEMALEMKITTLTCERDENLYCKEKLIYVMNF